MKVAILLPTLDVSGGVAVAFAYANMLGEMGHDVDLLSLSKIPYNGWYGRVDGRIIYGDPSVVTHMVSDIVYDAAIATFWPTVFTLRSGAVRARKVLYLVQGVEEDFYEKGAPQADLVRSTLVGPETKIAVSTFLEQMLAERYNASSVKIINGIDIETFRPSEPFMPSSGRRRVIVEGAVVSPHKRVHEALSILRGVPNIERWVLSASMFEPAYIDCELLLKMVPRQKLREVYSSADYLMKLSKNEGFGLAPLEMMACGGIPILEDFGGQRDYLVDGENGFLLKEKTRAEAAAIFDRLENKGVKKRMRNAALQTAQEYAWDKQGEQLLDAISSTDVTDRPPVVYGVSMGGEVLKNSGVASVDLRRASPEIAVRIRGWLAHPDPDHLSQIDVSSEGQHLLALTGRLKRPDVDEELGRQGLFGFDELFFLPSGRIEDIQVTGGTKGLKFIIEDLRGYDVYPVFGAPKSVVIESLKPIGAVLAVNRGGEFAYPELFGTNMTFIEASVKHCLSLNGDLTLLVQHEALPKSARAVYEY